MAGSTVLYFAPLRRTFAELCQSVDRVSWIDNRQVGDEVHWVGAGADVRFELICDPDDAVRRMRARYYPLAIVDCRQLPGAADADGVQQEQALHRFLERVRAERDPDRRFPFERIVVLIGGADTERTDRILFDAGAHHVGMCLRDGALTPPVGARAHVARAEFLHHLWDLAQTLLAGRKLTRTALCAAGGGITGIYYELGVLKCLQDACRGLDMRGFDMYFGISAGAIVSSLLANRLSIEEIIDQFSAGRHSPLDVQLGLRNLDVRQAPMRLRDTLAHLIGYLGRVRSGDERFQLAGLIWQLAALLGPFFQTEAIERRFARFFEDGGLSNDFRRLDCELYIGATEQDLRQHVLFGDEHHRHVPISKAVQASTAIHPFFRSVEIDGRHYTDGFVTRTSNLTSAIARGANLIFVIDPFLPLVSDRAGENARHGMLHGILQDYKTVAYSRFEQVSESLLRQHPEVTCFTFVPSNRMRRLMIRNPMSTLDFDAIVVEAYRSTYRRFRRLEATMGPRLQEHGIHLDLPAVERTIERLDACGRPTAKILVAPPLLEPAPQAPPPTTPLVDDALAA